ncbi:5-(carboxyamino)imidazole ribonucleotide synthase [Microbulbifer variabilis]|uniref:5-(carboxyamino)imidazole ribonucleotide synthase n=1 Tax=Microbulbifer variabilis TaxID=266805 RepID=UPI00038188B6|nr:5-(carboxyamino)imidazole ribonucleotide synthase [Microbulbifer variabilis]
MSERTRHIAIVGCGQLAQMMAQEGQPLGITFSFLAEEGENTSCVEGLGELVKLEEHESGEVLYQALGRPEVITAEREQVDVALLRKLQQFCPVYPDPHIFEKAQHRLREKLALTESGLPVASFVPALGADELRRSLGTLGYPVFIKSCENGYDGKNQWRVKNQAQLEDAIEEAQSQACVVEAAVDFSCEVSLVGVRSVSGEVKTYPLTENLHRQGTLLVSKAPFHDFQLMSQAQSYLDKLMRDWDYVGALTLECFVTTEGLIVNEIAPRVHNSGHWTLVGAETSQFANHLRAILDMPLGDTQCSSPTAMINMLGVNKSPSQKNEGVWLYGKSLREGRKMGHVILVDDCSRRLSRRSDAVIAELYSKSH